MKNSIDVAITFAFKGKTLTPTMTLDLDNCLAEGGEVPDIHHLLARENGIDSYSYEYEVLESLEPVYSRPAGLAAQCFADGRFDWERYADLSREARALTPLRTIAKQEMEIDDLDAHPRLMAALMAAYRAGKSSAE